MQVSISTRVLNVSWSLVLGPPPAPTCHPVPGCGAPHQVVKNMDVRPSTCHGQMELLVARTSGASDPSVSANMDRKLGDR